MPVDPASFRPVWLQVVDDIRGRIATGRLRPGDTLPGHEELAENYGVSPGTIRRAIGVLAVEELLVTKRGINTTVAHPRERVVTRLQPGDRLRIRPATPDERRELDLAEGADIAEVSRADGTLEIFQPRAVEFVVAESASESAT